MSRRTDIGLAVLRDALQHSPGKVRMHQLDPCLTVSVYLLPLLLPQTFMT
jgi:hypothetical protein